MQCRLFDLLLKTKESVQVFRCLTDKEIILLVAEKELTGELVSWKTQLTANPGRPIPRSSYVRV